MSSIYMYAHGGSGNHGCEAIVRASIKILNVIESSSEILLFSSSPQEETEYGVTDICNVTKDTSERIDRFDADFCKAYLALKIRKDYVPMDKLWYKKAFSKVKAGDIALSIGGDNYCYINAAKYVMLQDIMKKRKAKTVLWGCSVEPDLLNNPDIAADLSRYDLITARETITYSALRQVNPNTILVADPAFQLNIEECEIPVQFQSSDVVGINLSPMAIENEEIPGITWKNYVKLVDYIISNTDLNVALVPHVVWETGDDCVPLSKLYDQFRETGRVCMIDDRNCMQLKYVISKCRFFIGARTHATIAAYSTCVPTLVLGYSVKARGIARDIFGTEEGYVLPVQRLQEENDITSAFIRIMRNEESIRKHLTMMMPDYKKRALVGEKIEELMRG